MTKKDERIHFEHTVVDSDESRAAEMKRHLEKFTELSADQTLCMVACIVTVPPGSSEKVTMKNIDEINTVAMHVLRFGLPDHVGRAVLKLMSECQDAVAQVALKQLAGEVLREPAYKDKDDKTCPSCGEVHEYPEHPHLQQKPTNTRKH